MYRINRNSRSQQKAIHHYARNQTHRVARSAACMTAGLLVCALSRTVHAQVAAYIADHVTSADSSDPALAFYDPALAENSYLDDRTYALGDGGYLSPTVVNLPEPRWLPLLALPLALLGSGRIYRRSRQTMSSISPGTLSEA
jgi:hypothetical protein